MKSYKISFKDRIKSIDPILFWCSLAISLISIVTLISGLEVFGVRRLIMQVAMTVIGIVLFRDRLTLRQKIGVACGIVCVVIMNLNFVPLL